MHGAGDCRHGRLGSKPALFIYADDVVCGHGASAGNIDQDTLFAAAGAGDAVSAREKGCEAAFYAGQADLLAGERPRARRLFDKARRDCPPAYIEFTGAKVELARMFRKKEKKAE